MQTQLNVDLEIRSEGILSCKKDYGKIITILGKKNLCDFLRGLAVLETNLMIWIWRNSQINCDSLRFFVHKKDQIVGFLLLPCDGKLTGLYCMFVMLIIK